MKRQTLVLGLALAIAGLLVEGTTSSAQAQSTSGIFSDNAPLRFGFFGGANYNFVGAGAQRLTKISDNPLFTQPDMNDGTGVGFYFGAIGEYNSDDILGAALKLSVDERSAELEDHQNNRKFTAKIVYVTVEPMIRFNIISGLHVSAGPQLAVNLSASYDYTAPAADNIALQLTDEPLKNMNNVAFGIGGDVAYDFNLGDNIGTTKWYVTPFIGVSYINDQKKSDYPSSQDTFDDTWSTVTVRMGVGMKFGAVGE